MDISCEQFFTRFIAKWYNILEELEHPQCSLSLEIIEIQTILSFEDVDTIFVCAMFQDELLEVEESTLMWNLLSDLYRGLPGVFCCHSGTIWTLGTENSVGDFENLL